MEGISQTDFLQWWHPVTVSVKLVSYLQCTVRCLILYTCSNGTKKTSAVLHTRIVTRWRGLLRSTLVQAWSYRVKPKLWAHFISIIHVIILDLLEMYFYIAALKYLFLLKYITNWPVNCSRIKKVTNSRNDAVLCPQITDTLARNQF